jgi:hypothetical protein
MLVYHNNHGILLHSSNTLLHGTIQLDPSYLEVLLKRIAAGPTGYPRRSVCSQWWKVLPAGAPKSKAPSGFGNERRAAVGRCMQFFRRLRESWRPRPELNRGARFCRPLRNHSATWPCAQDQLAPSAAAIQDRVRAGNHSRTKQRVLPALRTCAAFAEPGSRFIALPFSSRYRLKDGAHSHGTRR